MKKNKSIKSIKSAQTSKNVVETTFEGAKAVVLTDENKLKRSVMNCLLWENEFYEDGETIANRIASLVGKVSPEYAYQIAVEARTKMHLRHVPLWIAISMAGLKSHKHLVSKLLPEIICRADELSELVAIYWKDGRKPLPSQIKKGLAEAFKKFDKYALSKYNRNSEVSLRDVMFLTHPKPKDEEQTVLWKQLANKTLESPDTWEVSLSAGKDKKETWTRLISENKLGGLAFLRNLRNMEEAGVCKKLVKEGLEKMNVNRILPFRFIAAANYAPWAESDIEKAMLRSLSEMEKLSGKTLLLVDVSGSMSYALSQKSDINRMDAACGLAIFLREIAESVRIYSFSNYFVEIPDRRGFALKDAIKHSQRNNGTALIKAVHDANQQEYDRIIVITDEQASHGESELEVPKTLGYMINVSSYNRGITNGNWVSISGWSDAIVNYIVEHEKSLNSLGSSNL